jgi:Tol biopolymer transport system component/DNA-binding winged helix-turn-helix (wHTH) protein
MENPTRHFYTFGDYSVDVSERQLLRGGEPVAMPPKVFDTLLVLVENRGRILEKDWLMQKIWPDSFVEESSLAQYVFQLRKTLADDAGEHRFIETIPKRGYRFIAPVAEEVALQLNGKARGVSEPALSSVPPRASEDALRLSVTDAHNKNVTVAREAFASLAEGASPALLTSSRFIKSSGAVTFFMALVVALTVGIVFLAQRSSNVPASPAPVQITKLTSTGRAISPAISPDGKYVAYVMDDLGKQSLWIRQTETLSTVQILTPAAVSYQGLTFSPDGNYLFYVVYKMPKHVGVLYRIPILGGTSQKLLEDVDTAVTFAPDGKHFAFVRHYPSRLETSVMVAEVEGGNERKLATRKMPQSYSIDGLSWAPDGNLIALAGSDIGASGTAMTLLGIRVHDGSEVELSSASWGNLKQVVWNKEGCGLLAIGWQQTSPVMANQVWFIPFPQGEPRRVTNDLINYNSLSLATETGKVVTTQSTKVSRLWLVSEDDPEEVTQSASVGIDYFSEKLGLSWLPDGRLIYGSRASGNTDIWMMNPDGSNQKQLTVEPTIEGQPTASPDGRYIAFLSNRAGTYNIWRMDADGGHPVQLTNGPWENTPSFTPDGKWIVYNGTHQEKPVLLKVPTEGGTPIPLTHSTSIRPAVSPDGKMVAHLHLDEITQQMKLAVVPLEGDRQVKMFEASIPEPYIVNWSPDGRMLTYVDTHDGVSNIWGYPLDGSQSKPLTNFKSDHIFRFAWSNKGRTLACERGFYLNDVVLISNFS